MLIGSRRLTRRRARDHGGVPIERADDLLQRFGRIPGAEPLLGAIGELSGLHLVGGAVRDLILGDRAPSDLDLVTEADPAAVVARLGARSRAHDRFGTCTFQLDGFRYDLAQARRETYARPGALPTVTPASLAVDLERRDFTANAAALGLTGPQAGTLSTVTATLADLRGRALRVLHDSSFLDDPTRLLRLARYASRLGFVVEPHTRRLADEALAGGAMATVSGSRLGTELRLLVHEPDPVSALLAMRALGLDAALAPGFGLHDPGLARRALALLPSDGDSGVLVLAAASIDAPPDQLRRRLDELAFTAGERDAIVAAASGSRELAAALARAQRPSQVAAAVGSAGPETVALAGAMSGQRAALEWLGELRHVHLEIDGQDLLAAGVPSGPAVGAGLRAALDARLDGRAVDRESQLGEALGAAARAG